MERNKLYEIFECSRRNPRRKRGGGVSDDHFDIARKSLHWTRVGAIAAVICCVATLWTVL